MAKGVARIEVHTGRARGSARSAIDTVAARRIRLIAARGRAASTACGCTRAAMGSHGGNRQGPRGDRAVASRSAVVVDVGPTCSAYHIGERLTARTGIARAAVAGSRTAVGVGI